jgi:DNA modification methylase
MSLLVINGNNIDLLKQYPDNYFDSVVTDPPYGLGKEPDAAELMKDWIEQGYHEIKGTGFMGKEWDAFVPQPLFWKEVFRVLKHGGHIVAFYGTRTYDWGVMAMRFAGFEVRDCIQWIYGSGFPKSHNISKAIDKMPKANKRLFDFAELLKTTRTKLGLSLSEADKLICNGSTMYSFIEGRKVDGVLKIYPPNKEFYTKIQTHFKINDWDDIVENNLENIGIEIGSYGFQANNERWCKEKNITQITTDQAKQWDGWGSALKPANEPIVLARKPLEKGLSIAENVLKWGTGGINIDGCRVGNQKRTTPIASGDKKEDTTIFNLNADVHRERIETNERAERINPKTVINLSGL